MENNKILGTGWIPTTDVIGSAQEGMDHAFADTGYKLDDIDGMGVTGYGRITIGQHFNAALTKKN